MSSNTVFTLTNIRLSSKVIASPLQSRPSLLIRWKKFCGPVDKIRFKSTRPWRYCKDANLGCWHFLPHSSPFSRLSPWGLQTLFLHLPILLLLLPFISGRLSAPTVLLRTATPFCRPNRLPKWFCLCPFVSLLFNQQRADCNLANQVSGFIKRVTIGCEDWQGRSFISEELPGLIESGWTEQGWSFETDGRGVEVAFGDVRLGECHVSVFLRRMM